MMAAPTQIHRDMGRLEGELKAVQESLDRIEKGMVDGFQQMDSRLRELEADKSQRKGALGFGQWLAGVIGGAIVFLASHLWK